MSAPTAGRILTEVEVGAPAHGGHAVARHDGRVIFVRHTAPGELVDVELSDAEPGARFWRGEAVRVHRASPDRVRHVWPAAGPGGVGGAELGHLTLAAQRAWKGAVITDTLRRIGKLEVADVEVHAAPGDDEAGGLGTRTRIELTASDFGRPAMFRHRSHDLVEVRGMPLAVDAINEHAVWAGRSTPGARLELVAAASGVLLLADGEAVKSARKHVREEVTATLPGLGEVTYGYRVAGSGFWQVHRAAPRLLVEKVAAAAALQPGDRVVELYSGAGLLTLPLADLVGSTGAVVAIEGDGDGVRNARRNAHAHPWIELVTGDVAQLVGDVVGKGVDVVVLDPPRAGAGRAVMTDVLAASPRRVVYVACDPASLARDLAVAAELGYRPTSIEGFDIFPHTHHVETIAVLEPAAATPDVTA